MSINKQLFNLYDKYWKQILVELNKIDKKLYTNPLLINIDEDAYARADYKVMIFGQETKGWYDSSGFTDSIFEGMDRYDRFFWQKNFYDGYSKSSFWKKFRVFQKNILKMDKTKNLDIIYMWNNISKIGQPDQETGVDPITRNLERKYFSVVAKEVEIIKPDLCIFMTGPNRDHDIKFHFPSIEFRKANDIDSIREMAVIECLGVKGLRLYHPSYFGGFNNNYKKRALDALNEIIKNH